MALAHAIDDKVEAAYRRGDLFDKRRRAYGCMGRVLRKARAGGHGGHATDRLKDTRREAYCTPA